MQGGKRDANRGNGKMSRVPQSHGASASAAAPDPPTPSRSTMVGQSEATLTTSAAASASSALAWAGFSCSVGDTARRGRPRSNSRPRGEDLGLTLRLPQHGCDRNIGLRSLSIKASCRPARVLRATVGFGDHGDLAALDLD